MRKVNDAQGSENYVEACREESINRAKQQPPRRDIGVELDQTASSVRTASPTAS
jgi:hypothetical protein